MPMVVFALGTKLVPSVDAVEIKLAQAKLSYNNLSMMCQRQKKRSDLIPVVTATCPKRLNQPVTQDAKAAFWGLESIAAQK